MNSIDRILVIMLVVSLFMPNFAGSEEQGVMLDPPRTAEGLDRNDGGKEATRKELGKKEPFASKIAGERRPPDAGELNEASVETKRIRSIIVRLNSEPVDYRKPKLVLDRIIGSTVYVSVDDEDLLARGLGSSGASQFIRKTTEALTSAEGIDCVFFDFEEGDHAVPGKYCN